MQMGAQTEKQTLRIIDDPCYVFVREWQFSLSCRVHADYSIRQKDWQCFTSRCCGMACLAFHLSHISCSSLFLHPLRHSLRACQFLTESNTTCQESAVWTDMR